MVESEKEEAAKEWLSAERMHKHVTLARISIIVIAFVAVISFVGNKLQSTGKHGVVDKLGKTGTMNQVAGDSVGNDANVLLSGGNLYRYDGLLIFPGKDGSYNAQRGKKKITIPSSISYINVVDDSIFYRDDRTRNISRFDINTEKSETVFKGNIGEIVVASGSLYFIDLTNGCLYRTELDGSSKQKVCNKPIGSFAIKDNTVYAIDNLQHFGTHDLEKGSADQFESITNPVERFFFAGEDVVVESGNTVYKLSVERHAAKKIYQSKDQNMRLIGASSDGSLFVQETGKLLMVVDGKATELIESKHTLYTSLLLADDEVCEVMMLTDENGSGPSIEHSTIKGVHSARKK